MGRRRYSSGLLDRCTSTGLVVMLDSDDAHTLQSTYSIATTPGLNPLFPALTISIANVAPHLRNVGVQASTRLMQLFKAFSAPNFLLAEEGHPRLVYYLLETINSILYHQLNGGQCLRNAKPLA